MADRLLRRVAAEELHLAFRDRVFREERVAQPVVEIRARNRIIWGVRRLRELPLLLLLTGVFAAASLAYGLLSYRQARRHLDGLVAELGETIVDTTLASLHSSLAILDELRRENSEAIRLKATFFSGPRDRGSRPQGFVLERFARAAGLKHILVFDADGRLSASARDVPARHGGTVLDPDRLKLALEDAGRQLAHEGRKGLVVRELSLPAAGLKPSLAVAVPLAGGEVAVLIQDAEAFARVRRAAGADAVSRRLEQAGRVLYVRFQVPPPALPPEDVIALQREAELAPGVRGVLYVGIDRAPVREALRIQSRSALLYGGLLVLFVSAAAWGLLRLRRSRDELRTRVQRGERLASLGRLAAGIAHEVRNPLNAIGLAVQRVQRMPGTSDEVGRLTGVVLDEVERLNRTVEEILRYARPREAEFASVDSGGFLAAVELLVRPEAAERGVRLRVEAAQQVTFLGDPDLLQGALWNLVRNAIGVSERGSEVVVSLARHPNLIEIEVRDRGPGVPEGMRDRIFEPFHTGSPGGSGLGLPLALSAVEAHGGTIEVADRAGGGAVFCIVLPRQGATR